MNELQVSVEQPDTDETVSAGSPQASLSGDRGDLSSVSVVDTLGRSLLEARKARGLLVSDVAQAIKFSPRQIDAIESDDFEKLPGTTFVRGFIRSYAKLLKLDPLPLLAMFEKQAPQAAVMMHAPQDTGTSLPQVGERRSPFPYWLLLSILLAISIAAAVFVNWPTTKPVADSSLVAAPVAAVVEQAVVGRTEPGQPETQGLPDDSGSQSLGPDIHQLIFVFEGKSWVEVKDASERVIFAQNNEAGTRQVVNGKPPFALVIGNASSVQLLYEDHQIDLLPYTKVEVARLTLE